MQPESLTFSNWVIFLDKLTQQQQDLITDNYNFCLWKTNKWHTKLKNSDASYISLEDIESTAMLGITLAALKYDSSKNPSFVSFADMVIDREIIKLIGKEKGFYEKNKPEQPYYDLKDEESPEDKADEIMDIKNAIEALPQEHKDIINGYYVHGLGQCTIAENRGVSQTKVNRVIREAKEFIFHRVKV